MNLLHLGHSRIVCPVCLECLVCGTRLPKSSRLNPRDSERLLYYLWLWSWGAGTLFDGWDPLYLSECDSADGNWSGFEQGSLVHEGEGKMGVILPASKIWDLRELHLATSDSLSAEFALNDYSQSIPKPLTNPSKCFPDLESPSHHASTNAAPSQPPLPYAVFRPPNMNQRPQWAQQSTNPVSAPCHSAFSYQNWTITI